MTKIVVALLTASVLAAGPVSVGKPAPTPDAGWFCSIFPVVWLCR